MKEGRERRFGISEYVRRVAREEISSFIQLLLQLAMVELGISEIPLSAGSYDGIYFLKRAKPACRDMSRATNLGESRQSLPRR